jgi:hypothetical protein
MHKARKRTAVEDWSWEAGKGENPRRNNRSPLEFPLRLSDERDRHYVHGPVLCAVSGWSLRDRRGPLLFRYAGALPRRLSWHAIMATPEESQLWDLQSHRYLSMM